MIESVDRFGKARLVLHVATAVLFIAVLVSGAVARVGRTRGQEILDAWERKHLFWLEQHLWHEQQFIWHEQYFVLCLCVFLLVAAIAVYGIRRHRGGHTQRRDADPLRSLEIGLAVGLALTAAALASWLASYGWLDYGPYPDSEPRLSSFRFYVDWVTAIPGHFAEKIVFGNSGLAPVGLEYFAMRSHIVVPFPDKSLQAWIEFACLNTLGWVMVLSPAVHHVRRKSGGRRSPRVDSRL